MTGGPQNSVDYANIKRVTTKFGITFRTCEQPDAATLARVYIINGDLILRGRKLSEESAVGFEHEQKVLNRVRIELPIDIPQLLNAAGRELFVIDGGHLWTLYRAIRGQVFGNWYDMHLATLESHRTVMTLLRTIHSQTRGKGSDIARPSTFFELYEPFRVDFENRLPPSIRKRVRLAGERFADFCRDVSPSTTCFIHGDYHHGNIVADSQGRPVGLIDLDWVHFGHPVEDLGFTLMMLNRRTDMPPEKIDSEMLGTLLQFYGEKPDREALADAMILFAALDLAMFEEPDHPRHAFWSDFHRKYAFALTEQIDSVLSSVYGN